MHSTSQRIIRSHVLLALALGLFAACAAPVLARDGHHPWTLSVDLEQGVPGGWVRVRENQAEGTRLGIHSDLNVAHLRSLRLRATRRLSDLSALHFAISSSTLEGRTTLSAPVTFNGTIAAPGSLRTTTRFPDFLAFDADYWHRLLDLPGGGRIWGSAGLTYVMLNFRLDGTIATNSPGHELKEDFYVQELPVPVLGLHLRYPLTPRLQLTADVSAGHLPWVNSFRTEGGEVRLTQTNQRESLGLRYRLGRHWQAQAYLFHTYFGQHERSREDGNQIRLSSRGAGVSVGYRF